MVVSTKPGDIVLDPFMGSGTVGVVAKKWERNWLGVELNPDYIAMANRRINAIPDLLPFLMCDEEEQKERMKEYES